MLLGEHAVLHGRRALVCAIDQRMTVKVFQALEKTVRIVSDLGTYESPIEQMEDHPDFRFVLDAVRQYPLSQGIELKITSDFSSDIGFGSSAAVTVATHAALMEFVGQASLYSESLCPTHAPECGTRVLQEIFTRSLKTVHRVQGHGSGADIAASVFGGVVAYRAEPFENSQGKPLEIVPLQESFPLTAVYSGSKKETADVIKLVEKQRKAAPEKYERIFDQMDTSVGEVVDDFELIGKTLVENQFLMEEMGLCNKALAEIIGIFMDMKISAKISGSGLGDCAVGLGDFPMSGKYKSYALNVATQGVQVKN